MHQLARIDLTFPSDEIFLKKKKKKKIRVKKELTNLENLCRAWPAPLSERSTIFAGGDCNVFLF